MFIACKTVVFDLQIGPNQVLSLGVREDLGAMTIKGYTTFSKYPTSVLWRVYSLAGDRVSIF